MALVATYGNVSAYNIKIYDMAGGGYYAVLNDGATPVFQRRNNSGGSDTNLKVGSSTSFILDHFMSYNYDSVNNILTLNGAVDAFSGVTFTRQESYKFVGDYIIENIWSVSADTAGGSVSFTNWNYYTSINAVWDIGNSNFGDGTSFNPLGFGVQLTGGGPVYGCISSSEYESLGCNEKRALASQLAIACTWVTPGDGFENVPTTGSYSIKQWFFKSAATQYDFMLQATLAVATAEGFNGTLWEKICKVTSYINTGLFNNKIDIKLNASSNYAGSLYSRDSFWQSFLISNDKEANIMQTFANNQQISGQIHTYINQSSGNVLQHDESTILYVIRSYYDFIARGQSPNLIVLALCLTYIASQVTNGQYQISTGGVAQSWFDSYVYTAGTYNSYNQGLYVVALKCAKLMGLSASDKQISDALTQYQALYDSTNLYMKFSSEVAYVSTDALTGDALSLFLLKTPLLTDAMVQNHINKLKKVSKTPAGMKCMCDTDGTYITFASLSGGDYQAGGSWFLYEYLAYYSAYYHGYDDAKLLMTQRIATELGKDPVSHEYLNTSSSSGIYLTESAARHVYSWNVASSVIKPPVRKPVT